MTDSNIKQDPVVVSYQQQVPIVHHQQQQPPMYPMMPQQQQPAPVHYPVMYNIDPTTSNANVEVPVPQSSATSIAMDEQQQQQDNMRQNLLQQCSRMRSCNWKKNYDKVAIIFALLCTWSYFQFHYSSHLHYHYYFSWPFPWFLFPVALAVIAVCHKRISKRENLASTQKVFKLHKVTYLVTNTILFIMNAICSSRVLWFGFIAAAWGMFLAAHYVKVNKPERMNLMTGHVIIYSGINIILWLATLRDATFVWYIILGVWTVLLFVHFHFWKKQQAREQESVLPTNQPVVTEHIPQQQQQQQQPVVETPVIHQPQFVQYPQATQIPLTQQSYVMYTPQLAQQQQMTQVEADSRNSILAQHQILRQNQQMAMPFQRPANQL